MKYIRHMYFTARKLWLKVSIWIPVLVAVIWGITSIVHKEVQSFYWSLVLSIYIPYIIAYLPVMRKYTRSRVQNYVLEHNIHLPRLYDRKPTLIDGTYYLADVHNIAKLNDLKIEGKIKKRDVSWLEYVFARYFWKFIDDDSNHDTHDGMYIKGNVYGNTFDLGDTRGEYPQWDWKLSILWLIRNTAYNYGYMYEEMAEDNKYNFYFITKRKYFKIELTKLWGWMPWMEFSRTYWHFGYIPYDNDERHGRSVYLWEDIDKILPELFTKYMNK